MTDWRPIESAPRDSSDVLVGRLDEDGDYWTAVAQWWVSGFFFMFAKSPKYRYPIELCFEPTHWMPLPEPPAINELDSIQDAERLPE